MSVNERSSERASLLLLLDAYDDAVWDAESCMSYETREKVEVRNAARGKLVEAMVDVMHRLSEETLFRKALYGSLAWAMRNMGAFPSLVRGQNDAYYAEWHAANDLLQRCRMEAPK